MRIWLESDGMSKGIRYQISVCSTLDAVKVGRSRPKFGQRALSEREPDGG